MEPENGGGGCVTVEIVQGDALKVLPGLAGEPPNFVAADP